MAKQPEILVPWKFVVLSYKQHILNLAIQSGRSPFQAADLYNRLLNEEPDEEMIALVQRLVDEHRH